MEFNKRLFGISFTFLLAVLVVVLAVVAGVLYAAYWASAESLLVASDKPLSEAIGSSEFYLALGNHLYTNGNMEWAEKAYLKAVELDPNSKAAMQARQNLAYGYFHSGQHAKAIEQLETLAIASPENPSYHYDIAINSVSLYFSEATGDTARLQRAYDEFSAAEALNPGYSNAAENMDVLQAVMAVAG